MGAEMKRPSKKVSDLVSEARNIANGLPASTIKQASESVEAPQTPRVQTKEATQMRECAAALRSPDSINQLKLAAIEQIVKGEMPV